MNKKAKLFLEIIFSVWILYHLLNIIILPNGTSIVGRRLGPVLTPYANTLGINVTWNFFSPDPAHTMYFEYRIHFADENKEPLEGYFPPEKSSFINDSSKRRLVYAMRYLMLDTKRLEVIMGPWLCKEHPGASEVGVRFVVEQIPSFDLAIANHQTPVLDLLKPSEVFRYVFDCNKTQDEVSL